MSESGPTVYGFVITSPPVSPKEPHRVLDTARGLLEEGKQVEIFLVGDGVYLARSGQSNPAAEALSRASATGGGVMASAPHIKAAGIGRDDLLDGVDVEERPYRVLVSKVMEDWERVVVC